MNLKSCVTKSKSTKHEYVPHKLRSRPFRFITLPIFGLVLFILYWFIICPLIFVALWRMHHDWPKEWPFYYWAGALIIFVILLAILVCIWRYSSRKKQEAESGIDHKKVPIKCRKDSNPKKLYTISLNTIQKNQDKPEKICIEPSTCQQDSAVTLEQKLIGNSPKDEDTIEKDIDKVFRRCSLQHRSQKEMKRPESLALSTVTETTAEVHSASSPLTPRELFFWDLIQNANKTRNSITNSFIEHEKEFCSSDDTSLGSPKSVKSTNDDPEIKAARSEKLSSTEYFIANVPDRKSLTAEVFLFVDGGDPEKCLKIRVDEED
ncbi:hypothetical protein ILUMI_09760, partial [Ignelater luminosus]